MTRTGQASVAARIDGVGWTVPWQPGSDFEVTG
ncbi:hypothetical protein BJ960_000167 [Leucobacter aridicollis]|uniref:Uncharacterized protein n=1 Tax=Leucobacter aridicollis TaxID=283878 RepID=A0A852RAF2_9MICO|nr:hypothetical protein [Leucobacter aridicollis]